MSGQCRSCNKPVVWVTTATGKSMPVDATSFDKEDGLVYKPDKHISHACAGRKPG